MSEIETQAGLELAHYIDLAFNDTITEFIVDHILDIEKQMREQLAQKIEESDCKCGTPKEYCDGYNNAIKWATRYIKGEV